MQSLIDRFNDVRRRLGPAGPVALLLTVAPTGGLITLTTLATTTSLPWTMRAHPGLALVGFFVIAWTVGAVALPTYASALFAGWVFGFTLGLPAALFGYLGAAMGAFAIGRRFGQRRVLPLLADHPHLAAIQRAIVGRSRIRAAGLIMLFRLSPVTPFAVANVTFGSAGLSWWPYIVGTLVGVLPRTIAIAWLGSRMSDFKTDAREGYWIFAIGLIATVVGLAIIAKLVQAELRRILAQSVTGESLAVK